MSLRVSTSSPLCPACSGDMSSGVPIICAKAVNSVFSVSSCPSALATPKSITLTTGVVSWTVTRTLLGLRSRWTIPFWWACCTAWQTETNSASRCRGVRWLRPQYSVIDSPLTSSITK
jgi:hypothetical protein